jgi:hypothetical protein
VRKKEKGLLPLPSHFGAKHLDDTLDDFDRCGAQGGETLDDLVAQLGTQQHQQVRHLVGRKVAGNEGNGLRQLILDDIENVYIRNNGDFLVGTYEGKLVAMGALKNYSGHEIQLGYYFAGKLTPKMRTPRYF